MPQPVFKPVFRFCLSEILEEVRAADEVYCSSLLCGCHSRRDGKMCLPHSRHPDEHDIRSVLNESKIPQVKNLFLSNTGLEVEIELLECLHRREVGHDDNGFVLRFPLLANSLETSQFMPSVKLIRPELTSLMTSWIPSCFVPPVNHSKEITASVRNLFINVFLFLGLQKLNEPIF